MENHHTHGREEVARLINSMKAPERMAAQAWALTNYDAFITLATRLGLSAGMKDFTEDQMATLTHTLLISWVLGYQVGAQGHA